MKLGIMMPQDSVTLDEFWRVHPLDQGTKVRVAFAVHHSSGMFRTIGTRAVNTD